MVQLTKKELEDLGINLNAFSALAVSIDESLSSVIKDMLPKVGNDNFGTDNHNTETIMNAVVDGLEYLDKVSEYALGLKSGIDNVIKTI